MSLQPFRFHKIKNSELKQIVFININAFPTQAKVSTLNSIKHGVIIKIVKIDESQSTQWPSTIRNW